MLDSTGKPLISLPEVLYYKHEVELKQEIRDLYKEVEDEVGKNVKKTFEEGSSKASYTHIRASRLALAARPMLTSFGLQSASFSASASSHATPRFALPSLSKSEPVASDCERMPLTSLASAAFATASSLLASSAITSRRRASRKVPSTLNSSRTCERC